MSQNSPRVLISVDLSQCRAHFFAVTMTLEGASPQQKLSLPVWTPGSYMVREFAQHIVSVRAAEGGHAIDVVKLDKSTFALNNLTSAVTLSYEVYGFDSSIRAAFIDENQAFFNGCALFLRPHGLSHASYSVKILSPQGEESAAWQVATGMTKMDVDARGFGSYQAADYDELVDHPFQISEMQRLSYMAAGIAHEMVLVGDRRQFNSARLVNDLTKLCEEHIALFGQAPFSSYLFIARFEEGGYGGLEHRNSSMLLSSPYVLPKSDGEPCPQYRSFLALCSHEYFHAWNIKRLKPKSFVPFDYDRECYTTLLWLFEGVTSYYDDLLVRRAGLISQESYLEVMGKNYGKLLKNRGRFHQTLAQSSFDAWIKFYRPNENSLNVSTSYYLKGSFIGLYLDLLIRENSNDEKSLDDVMRHAFQKYGSTGITEDEVFLVLEEVGGIDSADFKERFIYGTQDVPLASALAPCGIDLDLLADELVVDDKTKMKAYLGMRLRSDDNARLLVTQVEQDSPAMNAGLCPFDEIIAFNGIRCDESNFADLLQNMEPQEKIAVAYARKRQMRTTVLRASELAKMQCKLRLKERKTASETERLMRWLRA